MRLGSAVGIAGHPEERSMSLTDSGRPMFLLILDS